MGVYQGSRAGWPGRSKSWLAAKAEEVLGIVTEVTRRDAILQTEFDARDYIIDAFNDTLLQHWWDTSPQGLGGAAPPLVSNWYGAYTRFEAARYRPGGVGGGAQEKAVRWRQQNVNVINGNFDVSQQWYMVYTILQCLYYKLTGQVTVDVNMTGQNNQMLSAADLSTLIDDMDKFFTAAVSQAYNNIPNTGSSQIALTHFTGGTWQNDILTKFNHCQPGVMAQNGGLGPDDERPAGGGDGGGGGGGGAPPPDGGGGMPPPPQGPQIPPGGVNNNDLQNAGLLPFCPVPPDCGQGASVVDEVFARLLRLRL